MGELVPIVAIIFIFGGGIIKRVLDMMERRMEMRITSQDQNTASQIAAMRQELAQLRDTSTQFDMSIERRLDEMEHRLGFVESGAQASRPAAPPTPAPAPAQDAVQTIGMPHP